MKRLDLVKDDAHNQDKWRSLITRNRPTQPKYCNEGVILYGLRSRDLNVSNRGNYLYLISKSVTNIMFAQMAVNRFTAANNEEIQDQDVVHRVNVTLERLDITGLDAGTMFNVRVVARYSSRHNVTIYTGNFSTLGYPPASLPAPRVWDVTETTVALEFDMANTTKFTTDPTSTLFPDGISETDPTSTLLPNGISEPERKEFSRKRRQLELERATGVSDRSYIIVVEEVVKDNGSVFEECIDTDGSVIVDWRAQQDKLVRLPRYNTSSLPYYVAARFGADVEKYNFTVGDGDTYYPPSGVEAYTNAPLTAGGRYMIWIGVVDTRDSAETLVFTRVEQIVQTLGIQPIVDEYFDDGGPENYDNDVIALSSSKSEPSMSAGSIASIILALILLQLIIVIIAYCCIKCYGGKQSHAVDDGTYQPNVPLGHQDIESIMHGEGSDDTVIVYSGIPLVG